MHSCIHRLTTLVFISSVLKDVENAFALMFQQCFFSVKWNFTGGAIENKSKLITICDEYLSQVLINLL